jgi:hypothetical protein
MKFEKNLKSYSKNQRQWCSEQTWFDIKDTIHAIISKSKRFFLWRDNNYHKKLITKRLNQTTYGFLIFRESWQVARHYTWYSNVNQSIVESIINYFINPILFRIMIYIWPNLLENQMSHTHKNNGSELKQDD